MNSLIELSVVSGRLPQNDHKFRTLGLNLRVLLALGTLGLIWGISLAYFLNYEPKVLRIPAPLSLEGESFTEETVFEPSSGISRYIGSVWQPADSHGLRRAHQILLGLLSVLVLAAFVLRSRWDQHVVFAGRAIVGSIFLVYFAFSPWYLKGAVSIDGQDPLGLRIIGCTALIVLVIGGAFWRKIRVQRFLAVAIGSILIGLFAIGWCVQLDYGLSWSTIEVRMAHWFYVVGPADRLLHGSLIFEEVNPTYGSLVALFSVGIQRVWGEFSLLSYLHFIAILEVLILISLLRAYHHLARGNWTICVPSALLAGSTLYLGLWRHELNHSAWRYLLLWLLPWFMVQVSRLGSSSMCLLVGGYCLLATIQNFETGMAVTAGGLAMCAMRWRCGSIPTAFRYAMAWLLGALIAFGAWLIATRLILGSFPPANPLSGILAAVRLVASTGYGARLPHTLDGRLVVTLGSACYLLVYRLLDWRTTRIRSHWVQAGCATAVIVWFAYYANYPDGEYLNGLFPLFGTLIIDQLRLILASVRARTFRFVSAATFLAFGLITIPMVLDLTSRALQHSRNKLRPRPGLTLVPELGLALPADERLASILEKANSLKRRFGSERPVFVSVDLYMIAKLAKLWPGSPTADPFWEGILAPKFNEAWRLLESRNVSPVLLDVESALEAGIGPSHSALGNVHRRFLLAFRKRLAQSHALEKVENGWEVWRPRALAP